MRVPVICAVVLLFATISAHAADPAATIPGYALEGSFEPTATAGTYLFTGTVKDLATDKVVASPRVTAALGQSAEVQSEVQSAEASKTRRFRLTLRVDESGRRASATLVVSEGSVLVGKQALSLHLKP